MDDSTPRGGDERGPGGGDESSLTKARKVYRDLQSFRYLGMKRIQGTITDPSPVANAGLSIKVSCV